VSKPFVSLATGRVVRMPHVDFPRPKLVMV